MLEIKTLIVYLVMGLMLQSDGANEKEILEYSPTLYEISNSIIVSSEEWGYNPQVFVTTAFKESRFGLPHEGLKTMGRGGECGIYQQTPQYAYPEDMEVQCETLFSPTKASWHFGAALDSIMSRWPDHNFQSNICLYNGGYYCEHQAREYARQWRIQRGRVRNKFETLTHE